MATEQGGSGKEVCTQHHKSYCVVVDDVIMDCTMKLKMWEGLRDFGQMTDNWKGSAMMDLDIADIDKQVAIYMKTAGGK